jgi:hypothetical protein
MIFLLILKFKMLLVNLRIFALMWWRDYKKGIRVQFQQLGIS